MEKRALAIIAGVVVLLALVGLLAVFSKPRYQVEHRLTEDHGGVYVEVTVRGNAADLAVILTNPQGETKVKHISKKSLIDNVEIVRLWMGAPEPGTHTFAIKTVTPEKVVYKERLEFTTAKVTIEEIDFTFGSWYGKKTLEGIELTVRKEGNLPVVFKKLELTVDDGKCFASLAPDSTKAMLEETKVLSAKLYCYPGRQQTEREERERRLLRSLSAFFRPGVYPVRGKLYLDTEEDEFITLETDLRVR